MLVVRIISLASTDNVTLCCSKPMVWQWRVHSWYLASSDLFDFSHNHHREFNLNLNHLQLRGSVRCKILQLPTSWSLSEWQDGAQNHKLNRRSVWKRWRKTGVHCFVFSFALKVLFVGKVEKVLFNQEFKLQRNYSEVNFRLRQASKVRSVTSTIQPVLEMIKHHYLKNVWLFRCLVITVLHAFCAE